jgi:hypothetical protein
MRGAADKSQWKLLRKLPNSSDSNRRSWRDKGRSWSTLKVIEGRVNENLLI